MGHTRRGTGMAMLAAMAVAGLLVTTGLAAAQGSGQKPNVRLAPRVLVEIDVETPLLIQVGPQEALPANSFLQFRGLPENATLNEGHSISPGVWAVPLRSLPNLSIHVPQGTAGTSDFTVRVISVDGAILNEAKSSMIVSPGYVAGQRSTEQAARAIQPPAPVAAAPSQATAAIPPRAAPVAQVPQSGAAATPAPPRAASIAPEERQRLERFVSLGNRHLANGYITGAREFYRKAAEGGLAEGALLLATTYDPAELGALKVQGLSPDPAEARKWYERARSLGAVGVDARLARLANR